MLVCGHLRSVIEGHHLGRCGRRRQRMSLSRAATSRPTNTAAPSLSAARSYKPDTHDQLHDRKRDAALSRLRRLLGSARRMAG